MGVICVFRVYMCVFYKNLLFFKKYYHKRGYISIKFVSIFFNVIIFFSIEKGL